MKKIIVVMFVAMLLSLVSCTDAARAKIGALGSEHKVELYSGGQLVRTWISTGKVLTEEHSDGYTFNDKKTNVLVRVSGTVVVTPYQAESK